jgi:peptide-methionine (R)-S-oxide reductase
MQIVGKIHLLLIVDFNNGNPLHMKVISFITLSLFLCTGAWAQTKKSGNFNPNEVFDGKKVIRTDAEWKKMLNAEQFNVARKQGTEPAFSSSLNKNKEKGIYYCVACKLPLYSSDAKFDSGTGWPSFWKPINPKNVAEQKDGEMGMERTEVHCARCGAHLGHVFTDGPKPTGLRYCMDGVVLEFIKN